MMYDREGRQLTGHPPTTTYTYQYNADINTGPRDDETVI